MRIKKDSPMKYRGFYCPEELYKAMQDIAISLNESDSEYIRKAIEERTAKFFKPNNNPTQPHSNISSEMKVENIQAAIDKLKKQQAEPAYKPNAETFRPCPKGGK